MSIAGMKIVFTNKTMHFYDAYIFLWRETLNGIHSATWPNINYTHH